MSEQYAEEQYVLRTTPTVRRALTESLPEAVAAAAYEFITGPLPREPHRTALGDLDRLATLSGRLARANSSPVPRNVARNTWGMSNLRYSESIIIARSAESLYDMVADVTRMGEWSPVCKACWWDAGDSARAGAWFTGRNELPERAWETRSQVVAAERGREFAWVVGGSYVRWGYTFTPADGATRVTESWEFLPGGIAMFQERFGEDAPAQIVIRTEAAHKGIPVTLAALRQSAESA